jgi:hypothetical protein
MPRAKSRTNVQHAIEAQERKLVAGITESVLVSHDDLVLLADLISSLELTKVQILKKATHLGLQVLSMNTKPVVNAFPAEEVEPLFDDPNLVVPGDANSGWQFHGSAAAPAEETE